MSHTYGPSCYLARNVSFTGTAGDDDIPALKAQYFYSSPHDIDDPLCTVPASTSEVIKHPLRPFSACDNNLLEEAWLCFASKKDRKKHYNGNPPKPGAVLKAKIADMCEDVKAKGNGKVKKGKEKETPGTVEKEKVRTRLDRHTDGNESEAPTFRVKSQENKSSSKDKKSKSKSKVKDVKISKNVNKPEVKNSTPADAAEGSDPFFKPHDESACELSQDEAAVSSHEPLQEHDNSDCPDQILEEPAEEPAKESQTDPANDNTLQEHQVSDCQLAADEAVECSCSHGAEHTCDDCPDVVQHEHKSLLQQHMCADCPDLVDSDAPTPLQQHTTTNCDLATYEAKMCNGHHFSKQHGIADCPERISGVDTTSLPKVTPQKDTTTNQHPGSDCDLAKSEAEMCTGHHFTEDHTMADCPERIYRAVNPVQKQSMSTQKRTSTEQHSSAKCDLAESEAKLCNGHHLSDPEPHTMADCPERIYRATSPVQKQNMSTQEHTSTEQHSPAKCDLAESEAKLCNGHHLSDPEPHTMADCPERIYRAISPLLEHGQPDCELAATEVTEHTGNSQSKPTIESSKKTEKKLESKFKPSSSKSEQKHSGKDRSEHHDDDCELLREEVATSSENRHLREHRKSSCQLDGTGEAAGTSGKPFLQYESSPEHDEDHGDNDDSDYDYPEPETIRNKNCKAYKMTKDMIEVPVGISKLHQVELPTLLMKPIYWLPVHDIAAVTRGTWFYKDTMLPVEPDVANQLEKWYRELRPWSRTWCDELNSAIDVGAAGEEKITHPLWQNGADGNLENSPDTICTSPQCAARCFQGEAAAEGQVGWDSNHHHHPEHAQGNIRTITKLYPYSGVIYKDAQNAFILKPSSQPSAYYNRTPLRKIRKGTTVGIQCVRGFDRKAWEKLNPPKPTSIKVDEARSSGTDENLADRNTCPACAAREGKLNVTDLVLVIHGIGQKLSERVESFHFTHAINSFRRSVNAELVNKSVQRVLRPGLGGVMVLPVNWRANLSFEDGGPMKSTDDRLLQPDHFTLKDITPKTIPAVRNLISDVMLDIPFYMSNHKPTMIKAVTQEANRVYRLWCKNNPEFRNNGRVHIIAHSLGSAMALEALSKQPTTVPTTSIPAKISDKNFEFNTTNLFLVGSPAAFFLLLDKVNLIPRRGIEKPGVELTGDPAVTSEARFGCLAVDNIYNIMNQNDPIAYRLNATIDSQYAASLKNAEVPSATTGFLESIANTIRSITPGVPAPDNPSVGQMPQKATMKRLPSQLEMEVHDFSREEIAEKKFYLLNDNGQVDYFLSTCGGLEIQYLNMLGAHSSYWACLDFIRLIVVEVGRQPGRDYTLQNMRVRKRGSRASE